MQDTYKRIYKMAESELQKKPFDFGDHLAYIYKGFKISKRNSGEYTWKDVRFSDYYDEVDPKITENVLRLGFVKTLLMVMVHNDQDKLTSINRQIITIDTEINYWTAQATLAYSNMKKGSQKPKSNTDKLLKSYEKSKKLYEKKRRLLKESKESLRSDFEYYENRIKSYNN
ncbi:hypothetical protein Calle1_65 [Cellulophaga phage Calle_1]|uniref:Uncharacterized protein n=1 Tax=Cellulophaga phage Calle_1 TaxID=2745643 RepID=A0A8E4ZKW2_9CAUD|nr:hypothetical protein M1M22_gp050 [Cellulophaga phage Calle_1]QQV89750.1 hypothetical protein Calle1_65 [Cellulophaga phage Calle_1]QQV89839.1 hypothetical protein Calle2_65 [Cellulophaga phage Calle_2]QQV89880.1 hypothetical protein Calle3_65 [Cellulophaga phage Calle_3]